MAVSPLSPREEVHHPGSRNSPLSNVNNLFSEPQEKFLGWRIGCGAWVFRLVLPSVGDIGESRGNWTGSSPLDLPISGFLRRPLVMGLPVNG